MPYIGMAAGPLREFMRQHFNGEGGTPCPYGQRLNCAEINSSFYREHNCSG